MAIFAEKYGYEKQIRRFGREIPGTWHRSTTGL